jgi:hypothetical protein
MKICASYATGKFVTMRTWFRHWSLSWAKLIQSVPSRPIYLRYILILSSHICIGPPSGIFPSGFLAKFLYDFFGLHECYMPFPSHPPWFDHPNITRVKSTNYEAPHCAVFFSLLLLPLDYVQILLSTLSVLKHPLCVLFRHSDRPSFTPVD